MSKRVDSIRRAAAAGLLLLGAMLPVGCGEGGAPSEATGEPVELRTYSVSPEYQEEISRMLRSALESDAHRIGRVTQGPGGTLLVVAPPRIQAGVEAILDELDDLEARPAPAAPVKLSYWLLVGRRLDPGQGPFAVKGPALPPRVEPVLREIVTAQGPTEFALVEQLELTSIDRAQIGGRAFRVEQHTARAGSQVIADVSIALLRGGNRFQSQVLLEPSRVVVLAQSGFDGFRTVFPDADNDTVATLYYVMTADLDS